MIAEIHDFLMASSEEDIWLMDSFSDMFYVSNTKRNIAAITWTSIY